MEISKQEMDNLHAFVRPIIAGEKVDEMIPEKKKQYWLLTRKMKQKT